MLEQAHKAEKQCLFIKYCRPDNDIDIDANSWLKVVIDSSKDNQIQFFRVVTTISHTV